MTIVPPGGTCVFAQISDLHIRRAGELYNGTCDTLERLRACVESLNNLEPKPDFVIATGDLADEPDAEAYRVLKRELSRLGMPYFIMPGNHDDRETLREGFPEADYLGMGSGSSSYCIEDFPLRLIALDSLDPATGEGLLCEERLSWLAARLCEQPARPTMIVMHHQPLLTRFGFRGPGLAFSGIERLRELLDMHPQVLWITCGHLHRQIFFSLGRVPVSVAPSATYARTLTMDNAMPKAFIDEPPGYLVFMWHPELGIVCHNNMIGAFGAPHPMR